MPVHHLIQASGRVTHVFGHRFVVQTIEGAVLADLTPKGAELVSLQPGEEVSISGEQKPTEIKIHTITRGATSVDIDHPPKKHDKHHQDVSPDRALQAAQDAGYKILGEPRRKPKHFEVLARKDGALSELHIELDGNIRKAKPVKPDESKWADEIRASD